MSTNNEKNVKTFIYDVENYKADENARNEYTSSMASKGWSEVQHDLKKVNTCLEWLQELDNAFQEDKLSNAPHAKVYSNVDNVIDFSKLKKVNSFLYLKKSSYKKGLSYSENGIKVTLNSKEKFVATGYGCKAIYETKYVVLANEKGELQKDKRTGNIKSVEIFTPTLVNAYQQNPECKLKMSQKFVECLSYFKIEERFNATTESEIIANFKKNIASVIFTVGSKFEYIYRELNNNGNDGLLALKSEIRDLQPRLQELEQEES